MKKIGEKAKIASSNLSHINIHKRNAVLKQFSVYLKSSTRSILKSNKKDLNNAKSKKQFMLFFHQWFDALKTIKFLKVLSEIR